jgi:solute carrier family 25 phosphate transporter 3
VTLSLAHFSLFLSSPLAAIDVVKTRIQIDPAYKKLNILSGTRYVIATEGPAALLTGFGPTAVGYLVQGGAKFAGYEYWKKKSVELVGSQEAAVKYRTAIYLGSASIAEYVAQPWQSLHNLFTFFTIGSLQISF